MGASEVLQIVLKVEIYCLKGIDKIVIDAEKSTVTVVGDADPVAVIARVRKVGKMVKIVTVGPPPKPEEKEGEKKKEEEPCCTIM